MTATFPGSTPRNVARLAGLSYLIIGILGIFANFFVLESLIEPGNAAATADNILGSEGLFRTGIAALLIVVALDIVVALALYLLLKPVNGSLAMLAAIFRLVYSTVFGGAITGLLLAVETLGDAGHMEALGTEGLHTQVILFLDLFTYGWLIGFVFFAFHLGLLGYLILKTGTIPKVLGILLIASGIGYLTDSFAHVLLFNYDDYETILLLIVAIPSVVAELTLTFWLLFKPTAFGRISERSA